MDSNVRTGKKKPVKKNVMQTRFSFGIDFITRRCKEDKKHFTGGHLSIYSASSTSQFIPGS
jgi:hypothetical protein